MKQYKIFKHFSGQIEAVKLGWSWPAFFFTWIWALVKKLWPLGIGLLACIIIYNLVYYALDNTGSRIAACFLMNIVLIIISVFFGINGNSWREKNLLSSGYEYKDVITAANPEGAKALFFKKNYKRKLV